MRSQSRRDFLRALSALAAVNSGRGLSQQVGQWLPEARAITRGPKFHWRGYYDKFLFDPTNRYVLAHQVDFEGRSPRPDDAIAVGMVDLHDGDRWNELGITFAWNWQQGCMLQWVPGSASLIAWNDRVDGQFVTRLHDVSTAQQRSLPHPFYCFSPDGRWAFAPDFRRLNDTRPGYGYCGAPDPFREQLAPDTAGLWRMETSTGRQDLIFTFAQAAEIPYSGRPSAAFKPNSKHWFNHLLSNPDGTRLFFLHRWRAPDDKTFSTRAFTINFDGSDPFVLDPFGGTSHFVWRDPQHVFAFAWHPSHQERFYLYEDRTDRVTAVGPDVMTANGHNTYLPGTDNAWVLNDTYPDKMALQHPYLYHVPTNRKVSLGSYLSPPAYRGEWRCDTHPCASRDGKLVTFDSPHRGGRQVYLMDVSDLTAT